MTIIFVFTMGLIVGSFLNVCIYRLGHDQSVVLPASHCPLCKAPIKWYDNIPLISYAALRGKCRSCGKRISLRYPLVELLTGLLFAAIFFAFGNTPKSYAYMALVSGLIVATFIDLESQTIPDHVTFTGLALAPVLCGIFPSIMGTDSRVGAILGSLAGAMAGGALIFLIARIGKLVFKKDAMGDGDILLLAMIGAFLGWKMAILTFFIAPMFGAFVGIILKMKYGEEVMPYGPYLSLAAVISVFFGNSILAYIFFGI